MRGHNLFRPFLVASLALIIAWCAFAPVESSAQGGGLTVSLSDFGAVGDGAADDGPALQRALDALAAAGGGTLEVPAGRFAIVTPVSKDFGGAGSVTIRGVESATPLPPPTALGNVLSAPLDLVSEFYPQTGAGAVALHVSGLENFLVKDVAFVGTPEVETDAYITLSLADIGQATVRHCEFYGLITQVSGGSIVTAVRSRLAIEQTKFLGCTGNSGIAVPAVQTLQWKDIRVENSIFIDYGQRDELFTKTSTAAAYSWLIIGNAAQVTPDSPRREVTIREVFFDEGALNGLSAFPALYEPEGAPIDLVYITGLYQNVANLGSSGHFLTDLRGLLVEKSHYGWSQRADVAINLFNVGNAVLDEIECVEDANRLRADASTGRLTVINSVYGDLDSQAQFTDVRRTATAEEDPVQYVRQQFVTVAGRVPDGAAHYYWSDLMLRCGADAACLAGVREALDIYLNNAPAPQFAVGGQILDEQGDPVPGVAVALTGSQTVSTSTDAEGRYLFSRLPTSGVYTVTPALRHYTFGPASRTLVTPAGDVTADFAAVPNRHAINGRATDTGGAALQGVALQLSGTRSGTTTTDANGNYSFPALPAGGVYTITPSLMSYEFAPAAHTSGDLDGDRTLDFSGALVTHSISGRVTAAGGAPLAGATLSLTGHRTATATADANGDYSFPALPQQGDYTVTVSRAHYTFAQPAKTFNNLVANQTADFGGVVASYTLAGRVTSAGAGLPGVVVQLSGSQSAQRTTDANGDYSFTLPAEGDYTLTPSKAHYAFAPTARVFNHLVSNQTAPDFAATLNRHAIGGRVFDVNNTGLPGIVVQLSGTQSATTTTGAGGVYTFAGLAGGGNYTVTPSKTHYTFAPPRLSFDDLGGNRTADFAATLDRHTLSGRVANVNNGALPGVVVTLSGAQAATATTDAGGNFSFPNLAAGASYAVTPTLRNHTFAPASRTFDDLGSDQRGDFAGGLSLYQVGGRVTEKGAGLAGVTMTASLPGATVGQTTTDANGDYSFRLVAESTYTVTPSKENYSFDRAAATFENLSGDQAADFAATLRPVVEFSAAAASVSEGVGVYEVTLTRGGDTSGELTVTYAASDGTARQGSDLGTVIGQITFAPGETTKIIYVFVTDDTHVEGPETLTLRLTDAGGALLGSRPTTALTIQDNDQGATAANPVDDAQFFVRQHYRDFLSREPDADGLAFWTKEITSCGADAACVATKRENVSAAFFLSIEFKETGYLVYRLYKASYGRMPRRVEEFLLDASLVGAGVTVGVPGWDTRLAANREAYLGEFVSRPAFASRYPSTLSPAQFVSRLNANAGASLTAEQEAAVVTSSFGGAADSSDTRARLKALRAVAENAEFSRRELNRAFVLMQYFGYLQRNPDDPPDDARLIGYDFWLKKLDDNHGNFVQAQMVRAFIDSFEYRDRFGR